MREKKGFLSKLVLVRKRDGGYKSAINEGTEQICR